MFYGAMDPMPDFNDLVPWPDARFPLIPREKLGPYMKAILGRRFFKSHLLLESLPYYPELAMSLLNALGTVGDPLPPCPEDPRELWHGWMTFGWFEWESEGYCFWSNLGHATSYCPYRHPPNFHYTIMDKR